MCGTKNFSSVRLYSAPQLLHRTIVAILGAIPRPFESLRAAWPDRRRVASVGPKPCSSFRGFPRICRIGSCRSRDRQPWTRYGDKSPRICRLGETIQSCPSMRFGLIVCQLTIESDVSGRSRRRGCPRRGSARRTLSPPRARQRILQQLHHRAAHCPGGTLGGRARCTSKSSKGGFPHDEDRSCRLGSRRVANDRPDRHSGQGRQGGPRRRCSDRAGPRRPLR